MGKWLAVVLAGVVAFTMFVVVVISPEEATDDSCGPVGRGGTSAGDGGDVAPGTKVMPVPPGPPSSGFGPRVNPVSGASETHWGTDFGRPYGTPIYAAYDGEVVEARDQGVSGFGGWVILQHVINGDEVQTTYGHMQPGQVHVAIGDQVRAGQHIADVGSGGMSTGAHLHFEVRPGNDRQSTGGDGSIDPVPWLEGAVEPGEDSGPPEGGGEGGADRERVAATRERPAEEDSPDESEGESEDPPGADSPAGDGVLVVGDSLAVGAESELGENLPGVEVDAEVGRDFATGAKILEQRKDDLPGTVVIELGTNNGASASDYQALVDTVKEGRDDVQIVAVTPAGDRPWIDDTAAAVKSVNGVAVADWKSAVDADPNLLGPDMIHPTSEGSAVFADTISAAVEENDAPQVEQTSDPNCVPRASGGGTLGEVDLSKIPEEYHDPLRKASEVCPEFDMILFVGKLDLESGFQSQAESGQNFGGAGTAKGPGQFMDGTWETYGRDWNEDGKTDVYDPADAVPSSMLYNCENLELIKGWQEDGTVDPNADLSDLTLAAYQGGPDSVRAAGGPPNRCDINICQQEYVARARANGEKFRKEPGTEDTPSPGGHSSGKHNQIVSSAREYIGLPYVWGGNGPPESEGLDCSGLTKRAFKEGANIDLPRTSEQQWGVGEEIPLEEAGPGDLLFESFGAGGGPGHVAVASGGGKMIEAPQAGQNVNETTVRDGMKARRIA